MPILGAYILPHPPLILPEIGGGQEKEIQKTIDAYHKVAKSIAAKKPDTIILISPHSIMYSDYVHISPGDGAAGSFAAFGRPDVKLQVRYDRELVSCLHGLAAGDDLRAGTLGEKQKELDHGTMIPLYFVNQYYQDYALVRMGISGLSFAEHYRLGMSMQEAVDCMERRAVIIASGDLSHCLKDGGPYEYAPEGPVFDERVTAAMAEANFLDFLEMEESFCESAGECGLRAFIMMAGALDRRAVSPCLLSYEGPFGVGYAAAEFTLGGADESRCFLDTFIENQEKKLAEAKRNESEPVKLARYSLETYLRTGGYAPLPDWVSPKLQSGQAGAFVSLKKDGRLRGCIGTISPVHNSIAEEILANAVSAGIGDPRFAPVTAEELPALVYSVDVLSPAEPIKSADQLDVKKYGVIVSRDAKRGLLLPNLDGVTTVKQQIEIVLQKAGIPQNSSYEMERFEVVRYL